MRGKSLFRGRSERARKNRLGNHEALNTDQCTQGSVLCRIERLPAAGPDINSEIFKVNKYGFQSESVAAMVLYYCHVFWTSRPSGTGSGDGLRRSMGDNWLSNGPQIRTVIGKIETGT